MTFEFAKTNAFVAANNELQKKAFKFSFIPGENNLEVPLKPQTELSVMKTTEMNEFDFHDLKSRPDFLKTQLSVFICKPCKRAFFKKKTLMKH